MAEERIELKCDNCKKPIMIGITYKDETGYIRFFCNKKCQEHYVKATSKKPKPLFEKLNDYLR